jgi:hypothetical protein
MEAEGMMQIVKLDASVAAAARARLALIDQYEMTAALLRRELEGYVASASGVDLTVEQWHLDIDRGLLEREESVTDGE